MAWLALIPKALAFVMDWWAKRQADRHDADVRTQQQTQDALKGEDDAIRQVDRIGDALDSGGVRIADDPNNRNR